MGFRKYKYDLGLDLLEKMELTTEDHLKAHLLEDHLKAHLLEDHLIPHKNILSKKLPINT
jgi:hypothetical protein